jgi:hypothetical protein
MYFYFDNPRLGAEDEGDAGMDFPCEITDDWLTSQS